MASKGWVKRAAHCPATTDDASDAVTSFLVLGCRRREAQANKNGDE